MDPDHVVLAETRGRLPGRLFFAHVIRTGQPAWVRRVETGELYPVTEGGITACVGDTVGVTIGAV